MIKEAFQLKGLQIIAIYVLKSICWNFRYGTSLQYGFLQIKLSSICEMNFKKCVAE